MVEIHSTKVQIEPNRAESVNSPATSQFSFKSIQPSVGNVKTSFPDTLPISDSTEVTGRVEMSSVNLTPIGMFNPVRSFN